MKNLAILGSTGSIGTQTLEIVRQNQDIAVTALSARRNVTALAAQIREFKPRLAVIYEEAGYTELKTLVGDTDTRIAVGMAGLMELAALPEADMLLTAVVGMIGIRPTLEAIRQKKDIALANKETLVCAGHLIMPLAREYGVRILPVDSEHSAIFQVLQGNEREKIAKIWLTASGGPFRGRKGEDLLEVGPAEALQHPNWQMGPKITIDSATMVNKGLEVMEAKWLFGVDIDQIQVVLQPTSVIHSMVEYVDGAVVAQLGTPDMKLPIQYALYYPERRYLPGTRLDFERLGQLTFERPDGDTFFGLKLAYIAGRRGGTLPTVFNAANERAVALFLKGEVKFLEITEIIEDCMLHHTVTENPSLTEILATEQAVYEQIDSRR